MIDALSLSPPLPLSRPLPAYTAVTTPCPAADELSEDALEQVVGGLSRIWSAADAAPPPVAPDIAVAIAVHGEMSQRISA